MLDKSAIGLWKFESWKSDLNIKMTNSFLVTIFWEIIALIQISTLKRLRVHFLNIYACNFWNIYAGHFRNAIFRINVGAFNEQIQIMSNVLSIYYCEGHCYMIQLAFLIFLPRFALSLHTQCRTLLKLNQG